MKKAEELYEINYSNDVGPEDDGFWEWWEVRLKSPPYHVICKCDDREQAARICELLNKYGFE